jgi:transcription termination factor Rho
MRISDSALTLTTGFPAIAGRTGSSREHPACSEASGAAAPAEPNSAPTPLKGSKSVTDTQEQTLPVATESSPDAGTGAANGSAGQTSPRKRGGSLSAMLLPELQQIATGLGISTSKKKKSDLVAAIQAARAAGNGATAPAGARPAADAQPADARPAAERPARRERAAKSQPAEASAQTSTEAPVAPADGERRERPAREAGQAEQQRDTDRRPQDGERRQQSDRQGNQNRQTSPNQQSGGNQNQQSRRNDDDDDYDGGRRRGRRYRDRRGRNRQGGGAQGGGGGEAEPTISEDDVLTPVAGVIDNIEEKNTWFVRVEGFFASPDDVYVANSFVRRYGLRRGDAVTGAVRQPREGERREKYNPLVRLDTVNGRNPDELKNRIEFTKLTPLYPQERLRLETEPHILTTRVIDLVMPIGKGQRALIVSPPKAGKTMVLQAIANAIATNNPECHLMVVLVDERPEEVTDMQRSVKGEVIASTFDRKPVDHTTVAELSIERAKRLVEMGHDVVVLLDSITRLGRAYNLAAPASGRILSGGVDSTALYPPKRFLGAARNIENGGSLTILATALVETGSAGDTVIFEEFKGTGNAELKLDRKIADKRVFPAVDVDQSSTRKEEILLSPDELAVTIKLRRVLHALEPQQAIDLLLDRLRKTRTNIEFLMQIAKTTPGQE